MIIFQRDDFCILEKSIFRIVKLARGSEKIYIHFKRAEKAFKVF